MPQGKTELKDADGKRGKMVYIPKKNKLSGRGSSVSATQLSTADLEDRLTSTVTSGKDQHLIRQVLAKRNVTV